ncbi:MAG: winged helix-turn-helix transcriptional regulator [Chloracidobacterium sp.]|nr:winged helix-turn-helix transcriptional regulator [Chloracidobacterium sp.]
MKTDTRSKIISYLIEHHKASPKQLVDFLKITPQAIHRQLLRLTEDGQIEKRGAGPKVIYLLKTVRARKSNVSLPVEYSSVIEKSFTFFLPAGEREDGVEGFISFLESTGQDKNVLDRAKEFCEIQETAEKFRDAYGLIDGTQKIINTFEETCIEKVYYSDFYSLPKYGKSRLGQLLLHGKSGQEKSMIAEIFDITKGDVLNIIKRHDIDAVVFIPHSIPRKIPFLKEYQKLLKLPLPEVKLIKAYAGKVPIAQKSLSKLSERITNARETIFVGDNDIPYKRVLLIDDALGSGATMNETARKLLSQDVEVIGYVIVGSYKGFEVIKEV